MAKKMWILCWSVWVIGVAHIAEAETVTVRHIEQKQPVVQLAILLDTSSSMSGLIDQAKTQLWTIVNEFATSRKDGMVPELQVALYEYGNDGIPAEAGHIRMILPLTTDLDKVSQELFALTTNGGQEYCGMVIKSTIESLEWTANGDDLTVIFIAGNEPFTQGSVNYRDACKEAIEKGIIVNTIFCGPYEQGVSTQWRDGAVLADGKYMNIDQNRKAVHIAAPQDQEIAQLGVKLNDTYVAFGAEGQAGDGRQQEQDMNARGASLRSMVQRSVAKSSSNYRNAGWDLVDAVKADSVKLEELKDKDLPNEMQPMTEQERKDYLGQKAEQRKNVQQRINELNAQRKKYVAAKMQKRIDKGQDTLERVMINTIREQATKKHFTFESAENPVQE